MVLGRGTDDGTVLLREAGSVLSSMLDRVRCKSTNPRRRSLKSHRPALDTRRTGSAAVHIGFPVDCKYIGGNSNLGSHGHGFRIEGDRLGYGEFDLSHSIPLTDVAAVTISQRGTAAPGGSGPLLAVGAPGLNGLGSGGFLSQAAKITTDLIVRTRDGQEAHWVVEQRGGAWVQEKLGDLLHNLGIPLG
jgi:hypothetical protein